MKFTPKNNNITQTSTTKAIKKGYKKHEERPSNI